MSNVHRGLARIKLRHGTDPLPRGNAVRILLHCFCRPVLYDVRRREWYPENEVRIVFLAPGVAGWSDEFVANTDADSHRSPGVWTASPSSSRPEEYIYREILYE